MNNDDLSIEIKAISEDASADLEKLEAALTKLKHAVSGSGNQFSRLAKSFAELGKATNSLSTLRIDKLTVSLHKLGTALTAVKGSKTSINGLATSLSRLDSAMAGMDSMDGAKLSNFGANIANLSSQIKPLETMGSKLGTILNQLQRVNQVSAGLGGMNAPVMGGGTQFTAFASDINKLSSALTPLANIQSKLSSALNALNKVEGAATSLSRVNLSAFSKDVKDLTIALEPLSGVASKLTSVVNALMKIPAMASALRTVDFKSLTRDVKDLVKALQPLAKVSSLATNNLGKLGGAAKKARSGMGDFGETTQKTGGMFGGLMAGVGGAIAKVTIFTALIKRTAGAIAKCVNESNMYVENLNLFEVSMGEASVAAGKFADLVSEKLGLDPSAFMRYQGVLQQIVTGFGVVNDRAAVMSKNLTQLSYDVSSFFNISIEEASRKFESGIAGKKVCPFIEQSMSKQPLNSVESKLLLAA